MIRIATLKLRTGARNRIEGHIEPGVRVEVRRDHVDGKTWHLLATHRLVPAPADAAAWTERANAKPVGEKARTSAAARDLLDTLGGGSGLDDDISDIGQLL